MKVEQIATIMNGVTAEILGAEAASETDLTKILDKGREALGQVDIENYTRRLVDHIGRVVFVDRPYTGRAPSLFMESWEFGSVLEKIASDIPDAQDNDSWNLQNGETYNQDVFTSPDVSAKFYNSKRTLEVPLSIAEKQVYSAFDGLGQVNAFFSMVKNHAETSLTIKADAVVMETISGMIAETLFDCYKTEGETPVMGAMTTAGNCRAVNLLALYNAKFSKNLTAAQAITDPDFIRYAAYIIGLYKDRMSNISRLFNVGGQARFTSPDRMHIIFLSEFYNAASVYLQSNVFHSDLVKFPQAETVAFWQSSGTGYAFADTSSILVKTPSGKSVEASGILAAMFDKEACIVGNSRRWTTTHYNGKGDFMNNWFKWEVSPYIDLNENFVVFFAA